MWIRSLEWKKKKNVIVGSISTQRHREKILGDESPPRYPLKPSTVVCQRNHSGWLTDPTCEANRYCQVDICPDLLEPSDGAGCCFFSSFFSPVSVFAKIYVGAVVSRKCVIVEVLKSSVTAGGWRQDELILCSWNANMMNIYSTLLHDMIWNDDEYTSGRAAV